MLEPEQYQEPADEQRVTGDELFCFLDATRMCNMACVSFLIVRPEGKDYEGQPFACCSLLVSAHRSGKHLTVLAQIGADVLKHNRIKTADAVREANSPVASGKVL